MSLRISKKLENETFLLYEFPAEENFFQSFSGLFKEFYSVDFDAKGIKWKLKSGL